jgi:O-antigen/teichoic acid export membrane protein
MPRDYDTAAERVAVRTTALADAPPTAGRRRAAATNLVFNYIGTCLTIVKGIVFVPLYLKHFDLATYGAWLASANVIGLLGMLDVGLNVVFSQRLADAFGRRDFPKFALVAGSGSLLFAVTFLTFSCLGLFLTPWVPHWVHADDSQVRALSTTFALTAFGTALTVAQSNIFAISYAWQRTRFVGITRLCMQSAELIAITTMLFTGHGVVSLGIGSLASGTTGFTLATIGTAVAWHAMRLPRPVFERTEAVSIFLASVPAFASRLAGSVLGNVETAFVAAFAGPAAAAIYGLTDRIFRIGAQVVNPIAGSVFSGLAHFVGEHGDRRALPILEDVFTLWSLAAAVALAPLLGINRNFVSVWVGPDKLGGLGFNIALCASAILTSRMFLMNTIVCAFGEIARASWGTLAELAVRVPMMLLGLRLLGPVGIPLAIIVGTSALNVWWFPRLVGRRVGLSYLEALRAQASGTPAVLVSFLIGVAAALALPRPTVWAAFFVEAACVESVAIASAFLCSRAIRRRLFLLLARVRTPAATT